MNRRTLLLAFIGSTLPAAATPNPWKALADEVYEKVKPIIRSSWHEDGCAGVNGREGLVGIPGPAPFAGVTAAQLGSIGGCVIGSTLFHVTRGPADYYRLRDFIADRPDNGLALALKERAG